MIILNWICGVSVGIDWTWIGLNTESSANKGCLMTGYLCISTGPTSSMSVPSLVTPFIHFVSGVLCQIGYLVCPMSYTLSLSHEWMIAIHGLSLVLSSRWVSGTHSFIHSLSHTPFAHQYREWWTRRCLDDFFVWWEIKSELIETKYNPFSFGPVMIDSKFMGVSFPVHISPITTNNWPSRLYCCWLYMTSGSGCGWTWVSFDVIILCFFIPRGSVCMQFYGLLTTITFVWQSDCKLFLTWN